MLINPTAASAGLAPRPWDERTKTAQQLQPAAAEKLSHIPGVRLIPVTPPPLPGGGTFPVDFAISSTAEPAQVVEFANQLVQKAFASGLFIYADVDVKF